MKYRVIKPITHLSVDYSVDAWIDLDAATARQLIAARCVEDPNKVVQMPAPSARVPRKSKGD